ncbi:hypothetical protein AGMMS49546_11700 [Spirochaetia bacterium]|nr:hypothetical protein AGMMS49546_11700 [Spirochaetia bacterium]
MSKRTGPDGTGPVRAGPARTGSGKGSSSRAGPTKAGSRGGPERGPGKTDSAYSLKDAIRAGVKRDYPQAARILTDILSGPDAPPEAYLFLGRSLHALKDYSRALASFNDYIRLEPHSGQGYFFAGRSYLALGMPNRAVPILKKALDITPRNVAAMAMLGMAWLKSRHSEKAAELLQQAVETAAEQKLPRPVQQRVYHAYINALFIRGIRLCRMENYEQGMRMLRFVMDNSPNARDIPLLHLELGRACRELGLLEEALEHYTQASTHAPRDLRIRWYRASILMALGQSARALEEVEQIRSVDSGLPDLPWNSETVDFFMIRSFLETGEWRRAADACRDWLKSRKSGKGAAIHTAGNTSDAMIHIMYAEALRNLKDFTAALNHLNQAAKNQGDEIQIQYERLLVAWEGENWKALKNTLGKLSSLGADKDLIKRFTILLKAKTGDNDRKILGLLQDAVRTLGPEPELMYALGERYLKIGLIDESLSWFRKTRQVQKSHERAYLGEIAALEALSAEAAGAGKTAKAGKAPADERAGAELRAAYNRYLRLWPDNFWIRRDRALFLIHNFEYEEAVKELERLLVWEPSNPSLRRVLAYGYRKTGRFREAAMFLKSLLKENPRNLQLMLEFAGCLERAGASYYAGIVRDQYRRELEKRGKR